MLSRRTMLGSGAAFLASPALASLAPATKRFPREFLWGAATAAHQVEGGNTNSDLWLLEQVKPTAFLERSGDACDSYNRFAEDISILARLGLNSYRFGIEWARIEPVEGEFSNAQLDHYALVMETCRKFGVKPVVTFSHFSFPAWFAKRGGFERDDAPDLFARYCRRAAERLGPLMELACTFNEANAPRLLRAVPDFARYAAAWPPMLSAAAKASGSDRFVQFLFSDPGLSEANMIRAHKLGYEAIKAVSPKLPVGITLTIQDIHAVGNESVAQTVRDAIYGGWLDATRADSDFVGVQTYFQLRVGSAGLLPPEPGPWGKYVPEALENAIRWAHRTIGKPIFVTENGLETPDDQRRVQYIDAVLPGVLRCITDGIPVKGYFHWSLLDNFEWAFGYKPKYGLVAVDRSTFARVIKPSGYHFGRIAHSNTL